MLSAEASHSQTMKGLADQMEEDNTILGLTKKFSWWMSKTSVEEKDETRLLDIKSTVIYVEANGNIFRGVSYTV